MLLMDPKKDNQPTVNALEEEEEEEEDDDDDEDEDVPHSTVRLQGSISDINIIIFH